MEIAQASPAERAASLNADIIRILGIFLVILGPHTAAHLLYQRGIHTRSWMTGNLYDAIGIVGVPMFLMLSGYLLLGKQETYSSFFRKRVQKVVLPFLGWIVIYYGWHAALYHQAPNFRRWLWLILSGQVYSHLWFMFVIITLYVMTPLLRKLVQNASKLDVGLFMFLWLFWYPVFPFVQSALNLQLVPLGGEGSGFIHDVIGYAGYYVAGYVVINAVDRERPGMRIVLYWGLLLLGFLWTALGTYVHSLKAGQNQLSLYVYFSPSVTLTSISVVILLTHYARRYAHLFSLKTRAGLHKLAEVVFGIYFFHIVFLELFVSGRLGFVLNQFSLNPPLGIPFFAILLFALSAVVCLIIGRLPLLKHIT